MQFCNSSLEHIGNLNYRNDQLLRIVFKIMIGARYPPLLKAGLGIQFAMPLTAFRLLRQAGGHVWDFASLLW